MPTAIAILVNALALAILVAAHYRAVAGRRRREAANWRSVANVRGRLLKTAWARKLGPEIDKATAGRILDCLCQRGDRP